MQQTEPVDSHDWSRPMAIYVAIKEVSDDKRSAEYLFGRTEKERDRLWVDKSTGEIDLTLITSSAAESI